MIALRTFCDTRASAGTLHENVILEHYMSEMHDPTRTAHAVADRPTLSLLRLSAVQRLAGAALVLALLWLAVVAVLG